MDIDEFCRKYGVTGEAHLLAEYVTFTDPDDRGSRHKLVQRQWAVVVQHSAGELGDQRVLLIDYRAGTGIDEPDVEEVLGDYSREAIEGTWTFPDYAGEHASFQPHHADPSRVVGHRSATPDRLYARWVGVVDSHYKLADWCATPEMLAELYQVHTG